jgi:glycosyltransferase involved in cell wall biosynthesis
MTVLYITQNGVTDHIGRSQVAPYVLALARQGFRIHVLSAEKTGQERLIEEYKQLFEQADVRWTRVAYRNQPKLIGQALTQRAMRRAAIDIIQSEDVRVVHCRSFPPALIAHRLKPRLGVKFIFDFRDFYADGGLAKARGFSKLAYYWLKGLEGPMIRSADKIVCLTHKACDVLSDRYLRDVPRAANRFQVIPCCADFEHFDTGRVSESQRALARRKADIPSDAFVLLYLGSLGPDYLLPQMLKLFRQLQVVRQDAWFLFVSNNGQGLVASECESMGIDSSRVRFVSADRTEVPSFIALADLSVLFIRADVSKAGCSPTKLAELFACDVPVIANSGVGDLDAILDLERNSSVVVKDFTDATLRSAIERVLEARGSRTTRIRENSREFALEAGVARYAAVYKELLAH